MKQVNTQARNISILTHKKTLEPIFTLKNFPAFAGCVTEKNSDSDYCADMDWGICTKTGIVQLLNLVPLEILYLNQHNEGIGKVWTDHYKEFTDFVNQFSPKNILEIGGAHGLIGSQYLDTNSQASWTVIDPNPTVTDKRLKVIAAWFDENFKLPHQVDSIVHSHVLEHLYDPNTLLRHIRSFLKTNQLHIFTVPNIYSFLQKKYTNSLNFEHTLFLSEEIIDYLLATTGFKIIKKHYFQDHSIFYATKATSPKIIPPPNKYDEYKSLFLEFIDYHKKMIASLNSFLEHESTPTYLFGAHLFSQFLIAFGLDTKKIVSILDNSNTKQGKRLYGTELYVESPKVLKGKGKVNLILKAANYNEEIKKDILENINSKVNFL